MVSLFVLFGVRIWACCHKGCRVNGVIVNVALLVFWVFSSCIGG